MALMTEEKTGKPSLWNQALKVVKGDSTTELVEQFTQEMTLVAEGLSSQAVSPPPTTATVFFL